MAAKIIPFRAPKVDRQLNFVLAAYKASDMNTRRHYRQIISTEDPALHRRLKPYMDAADKFMIREAKRMRREAVQ